MDIATRVNWVDLLVIILMMRISYVSFQDGLSHEIFPLFGAIGTATLSLHYYHGLAVALSKGPGKMSVGLAGFLVFLALVIIFGLIFKLLRVLLDKVIKVTWHPSVERFGGLVVGALRAAVVTSIVLIMLALMPLSYLQHSIRERSLTGMYFLSIGPNIYGVLGRFLPTIGIESTSVNKEAMVKDLVADKSVSLDKK